MKLSKQTPLIPGAKDVINMLQKEGNELIVISARGGMIEEMKDVAMEKFKEEKISFNTYYSFSGLGSYFFISLQILRRPLHFPRLTLRTQPPHNKPSSTFLLFHQIKDI